MYETIKYDIIPLKVGNVIHIQLDRPSKKNAMNSLFWDEIYDIFIKINESIQKFKIERYENNNIQKNKNNFELYDIRVVLISGNGSCFTSGLDISDLSHMNDIMTYELIDSARKSLKIKYIIIKMQKAFQVIQNCLLPVIGATHGWCIGAGIDLITACDIRISHENTIFSIREIKIGLAADLGTLQRTQKICGNDSLLRELCFTGRNFNINEAKDLGLISYVIPTKSNNEDVYNELITSAFLLCENIAIQSPIALIGTKYLLNYSREHSIDDGLEISQLWNMSMLNTNDLFEAMEANITKETPTFSRL